MSVLVTGGAGYIGSHAVIELLDNNENVVVIDNLENGFRKSVADGAEFVRGDLRDMDFVDGFFSQRDIDSVIHFAAYSLVGESVGAPYKYYHNNVQGAMNVLQAMSKHNVKRFVFSSTAAVYGEPENLPIAETDKAKPKNPYGETKLTVERALKWFENAFGIKYVVLRYFNVAGAHESGKIGEAHNPETHLIPIVLKAALGKLPCVGVYGADYDTPDGTCIRDYIHVKDLSAAHVLAMNSLCQKMVSGTYNLGNGNGFSVKEVIDTAVKVTGREIVVENLPRRAGDPSRLVASSEKIMRELGYSPKNGELESIIESAWKWHLDNPDGFTN